MASGSIALMSVTSRPATTRKAPMNDEQFSAELSYQVSLALAETLLQSELMTDKEFAKAKALLLERYKPVLGSLFAESC